MIDITGLREDKRPQSSTIVHALLDRLEAAESECLEQARLNGMGSEREAALMAKLEAAEKSDAESLAMYRRARDERDELRAKIEAMERQEPVGTAMFCVQCSTPFDGEYYCPTCGHHTATEETVYALPGAQPAPRVPDGWMQHAARMAALARKLREPDWHFESIREMQRELCALEEAALAAAPEAKT